MFKKYTHTHTQIYTVYMILRHLRNHTHTNTMCILLLLLSHILPSPGAHKSITVKILHFYSVTESRTHKGAHTWQRASSNSVTTFAFTFWFANLNVKYGPTLHQTVMAQAVPRNVLFLKTNVSLKSKKTTSSRRGVHGPSALNVNFAYFFSQPNWMKWYLSKLKINVFTYSSIFTHRICEH